MHGNFKILTLKVLLTVRVRARLRSEILSSPLSESELQSVEKVKHYTVPIYMGSLKVYGSKIYDLYLTTLYFQGP